MKFISDDHEAFYNAHKAITKRNPEARAVVYTLGINRDTRAHFDEIYSGNQFGQFYPDAIHASWQTGASRKVTRLAFNLYTWTTEDGSDPDDWTPHTLFTGVDTRTKEGMLLAINYFC